MRYSMIMAGGSGTRLWPMSTASQPKQLLPFIRRGGQKSRGRSLIDIADARLEGLVPAEQRYICAGRAHEAGIRAALKDMPAERYLAEPVGRDTLNAVGLGAAVIGQHDPDAVIAVFTADHVIEPVDVFQKIVRAGFALADKHENALVTFGITPTHPATGYGYLKLGDAVERSPAVDGPAAFGVRAFKEKPAPASAQEYFDAGPKAYLWNSGMFVWRAATLLQCIERYQPENHAGLLRIAEAWDTPQRDQVLDEVYPTLNKISVDFAVMEPASRDKDFMVAALPMALSWLDVGSWPSYAQTCEKDEQGNALAAARHVLIDTKNTLVASSDDGHLIATIGCEDLIIVHTPQATLVCRADQAEQIKKLHAQVGEQFGSDLL